MKNQDQNVIVMRHGDRMDNFDPKWVTTADRPWDPPLYDSGLTRAALAGQHFRSDLGFPIHRVFVSPFLRCVQTAAQVVSALGAADVKLSIEYGLCEMLNFEAIRHGLEPKDRVFSFNISELEAMLPAGTVDHSVERIYSEVPHWGETVSGCRSRYERVMQALANRYPSENLLLVTHGEGVLTTVKTLVEGADVKEVNYCAHVHARRRITFREDHSFTAGGFQLLTLSDETNVVYEINNSSSDII